MKKLLTFSLAAFCAFASAQELQIYEYQRLRIGVEAGLENLFGSNVKPAAIRESQSFYYGDYYHGDYYYGCGYMNETPSFTRFYFGVKPEYSLNYNFAVAAGLRFAWGKSSLISNRDYFLWKVQDTETMSNYIRINDINQTVYNIGIPLEFKVYPGKSDVFWRMYFKAGAVFNFAFAQDVAVDFTNAEMKKYLPEIKKQFESPDFFNGHFILAIGFKIGRQKHPFGAIELQMPIQFTNKPRLNSLFKMEDRVGVGVQTTLFFPVGKQKLSYQYRPR
ncbi:MAG: hypothetical protein LBN23_07040 [Paludibacter sp.]|jgi:hypothetical protein|nr:hypothetical protein [Paludibacter sp.]